MCLQLPGSSKRGQIVVCHHKVNHLALAKIRIQSSQRCARQTTVLQDALFSHNMLIQICPYSPNINLSYRGLIQLLVQNQTLPSGLLSLSPGIVSLHSYSPSPSLHWSLSVIQDVSRAILQILTVAILNFSKRESPAHSRKIQIVVIYQLSHT